MNKELPHQAKVREEDQGGKKKAEALNSGPHIVKSQGLGIP